jgi:hypothetical protein
MLDPNYRSWSEDRIRQEIRNRERHIQTLEASIRDFDAMYDRYPQDGYQGRGVETEKANAEWEIALLSQLL